MADTSIEWTNKTWNPIHARNKETRGVGHYCEKVSPGCAHCYAERMQKRFRNHIRYNAADRDKVKLFLDRDTLDEPLHWRKARNVFPCSMTDIFGGFVIDEWLDSIFAVMALTPHLTYQVLTKRMDRARGYLSAPECPDAIGQAAYDNHGCLFTGDPACSSEDFRYLKWPLPNVWIGASVENQEEADRRIPLLLQTPAAVRFISAEPLLGAVDLTRCGPMFEKLNRLVRHEEAVEMHVYEKRPPLDWVIVGGESGPGARPCELGWIRSIVEQCKAAGVACFVKQLGAVPMVSQDEWMTNGTLRLLSAKNRKKVPEGFVALYCEDSKGGNIEEFPADLRIRQFPVTT